MTVGQAEGRTASARKAVRRASGSTSMTDKIRSSHRQHDTGQTGAGAHVHDRAPDGISSATAAQLSRCRSQMPRRLAGADQSADHAVGGQQLGVRATASGPKRGRPNSAAAAGDRQAAAAGAATEPAPRPGTSRRVGRRRRWTDSVAGRTTIRRLGSTPSDSLSTPAMALTTSCTHLRSNADIGSRRTGLAVLLDLLDRVLGDRGQLLAPGGAVAADVEQQPARRAGLPEDRQPGQLLQRLQRRAALADEGCSRPPTTSTTGRPAETSSSMSPS